MCFTLCKAQATLSAVRQPERVLGVSSPWSWFPVITRRTSLRPSYFSRFLDRCSGTERRRGGDRGKGSTEAHSADVHASERARALTLPQSIRTDGNPLVGSIVGSTEESFPTDRSQGAVAAFPSGEHRPLDLAGSIILPSNKALSGIDPVPEGVHAYPGSPPVSDRAPSSFGRPAPSRNVTGIAGPTLPAKAAVVQTL